MTAYKNFIIDFGGVLYRINESRTVNAFKEISNLSEQEYYLLIKTDEFNDIIVDFEKGILNGKQYFEEMKDKLNLNCEFEVFKNSWNMTLLSLFDNAIENIKMLKEKGSVVLLSNTNDIHYNKFEPECNELFSLFDKCYFSFKLGMRKPDTEFFKYVVEDRIYAKETTIFIDDSAINLKSAKEFGLGTFKIGEKGIDEFINYLK
ncbi:MAG: HAD-IA family hydrolase [bacterium]